jgi:hypothetical protein
MVHGFRKAYALLLFALLLIAAPLASAASLRAGAAKVDISPTPDEFPYTAVGARHIAPFIGNHDAVYARAIFLDDGATQVAFVVVDVTAIPNPGKFLPEVARGTGLPESHIFIAANHTHSVPLVNYHLDLPYQVGEASPQDLKEIDRLIKGSIDAIRLAKAALQPARVAFGRGEAFLNINSEDPHGPSDKSLDVLRIDAADGSPIAALVDYSVPSGVTSNNYKPEGGILVSGDLYGEAARLLEAQTPKAPIVLFASSSDGDQRLLFGGTLPAVGTVALDDSADILYAVNSAMGRNLANVALSAFKAAQPGDSDVKITAASKTVMCPGGRFSQDPQTHQMVVKDKPPVPIPLNLITIGNFAVAGIGGNVPAEIGLKVKSESPFAKTTLIGGTLGSVGYIMPDSSYTGFSHSLGGTPIKAGCAEKAITQGLAEMFSAAKK